MVQVWGFLRRRLARWLLMQKWAKHTMLQWSDPDAANRPKTLASKRGRALEVVIAEKVALGHRVLSHRPLQRRVSRQTPRRMTTDRFRRP